MLGTWEIAMLVGAAVLLFGGKRLPGVGKALGESIRDFKKAIKEDDTLDVTESAKREQIENSQNKKSYEKSAEKESEKN